MADVLRAPVIMGGTGNGGSMAGWITLYDNHGNSTRGMTLTCAGHPPITMDNKTWMAMHGAIDPHAFRALNFDGTIPMLYGIESPLQTVCRKLEAEAHHKRRPAVTQTK